MKTELKGWLMALAMVAVLPACSDDDDDVRVSDVPVPVQEAFQSKFPDVTGVEWERERGYYVADFWQEGLETHVWIDTEGTWRMTELDFGIRLTLLPQTVQDAFRTGAYASWRVDDVGKYERPDGIFYLIEVETNGKPEHDLFFGEDGSLLKDEIDNDGAEITPDTVI